MTVKMSSEDGGTITQVITRQISGNPLCPCRIYSGSGETACLLPVSDVFPKFSGFMRYRRELRIESEKGDRREEILDISDKMILSANVKNTGKTAGKEVVQFYGSMPQGKLGKPAFSPRTRMSSAPSIFSPC